MTEPIKVKVSDEDFQKVLDLMRNQEPYPDEMFDAAEKAHKQLTHEEMLEIAAEREAKGKAFDALDKLYKENGNAMLKLAEIEKEEWKSKQRSDTVLARYNAFYNDECSGMPHGTPITPEHMQAMTLECMIDALTCENLNVEYNDIAIDDIKDLISRLHQQGNDYLERVRKNNETL